VTLSCYPKKSQKGEERTAKGTKETDKTTLTMRKASAQRRDVH